MIAICTDSHRKSFVGEMMSKFLQVLIVAIVLLGAIAHEVDIRPRKLAPDFTAKSVIDDKFKDISLSDYRGKWVVMLFYPYGMYFLKVLRLFQRGLNA
jgi:AhpC/TSA family